MSRSQARSITRVSISDGLLNGELLSSPQSSGGWEGAPRRRTSFVFEPHLRELLAHLVHVEAEHAGSQLLALLFLGRSAFVGGFGHLRGIGARHDADAIVVGHDDVARLDALTRAQHWHVD